VCGEGENDHWFAKACNWIIGADDKIRF